MGEPPKLKEKAGSGSGSLLEFPNMERTLRPPEVSLVSMDWKLKKEPPCSSLLGDSMRAAVIGWLGDATLPKSDAIGCSVE